MTLQFWYNGSQLAAGTVRIDEVTGLTSSAESGTVGMSQIVIDDPDGTLTITGLKPFYIVETQCSEPRVWTGYLAERQLARGREEHLIAGARTHVCTLMDLNANLGFRVFTQDAAKRPRETDVARVAWMLTQTQATDDSRINDNGLVSTANAGQFDEADYRGQYPGDLLASVAASSVKNYYIYWDTAAAEASLYYDKPDAAVRTSTLQISNVDADVDDTTTFAPVLDAVLTRDPSSTYSGVRYGWVGGYLYVENATTEANFIARDATYSTDRIGRLTTAQSQSAAWLAVRAGEQDRIHVTIQVPLDRVNLILEGQRLQVKFSHLPSYTSYTYVRVARRTVRLVPSDPRLYELELELTNSTPVPGSSGNPGGFPIQPTTLETPSIVQSKAGTISVGSLTLVLDAAPTAGDLLVCMQAHRDANAAAIPTGFTAHPQGVVSPAGGDFFRMSYRVVQGGDSATWVLPGSGLQFGILVEVADAAVLNAWSETTGIVPTINLGSTTPTQGVPAIVIGGFACNFTGADQFTYGNPTATPGAGYTEIWDATDGTGLHPHAWGGYQLVASTSGSYAVTATHLYSHAGPTWGGQSMVFTAGVSADAPAPAPGQPVNGETPTPAPNGTTADFSTANPYGTGTLLVFCDGINVNAQVTETDPTTGAFALDFAPLATDVLTTFYLGR